MKKLIILGAVCFAVAVPTTSWARAWRCPGNYYTNDAEEARRLQCSVVGEHLTVINSGPGASRGGSNTNRGGGSSRPATPQATPPSRQTNSDMQIDSTTQNSRDGDARRLLEAELSNKQSELALLQSQYNDGQPERLVSEATDDARYQTRVEGLRREIQRRLDDIISIQNEIARLR